jgi:glycosyltransferase involved in cell wall biosynthesis
MMSWKAGDGHIEQTLQTIFNQTHTNFELLIYDDCSPEDPSEQILSLIQDEPRASFLRGEARLGSSMASQYVLKLAPLDTDYFAWMSDHDLYDKCWLEKLMEALNNDIEAAVSYPLVTGINSNGSINERQPTIYQNSDQSIKERIDSFLSLKAGAGNIIWGLFRFNLLKEIGGWPKTVVPDIILLARLTLIGSIVQIDERLHVRREQGGREKIMSSPSSSGMISRQITGIFPSRPFYTYLEYRLVNSAYLFYKEPFSAAFNNKQNFRTALFLWKRYNRYYVLQLLKEMPQRVISNRVTRYIQKKL